MKVNSLIVALMFLIGGNVFAQQGDNLLKQWVHPGNKVIQTTGYEGAQSCTMCHQDALDEIVHTVHWNLASPVRNVQGLPDGSPWGMVNRECALAGSTSPSNWIAATDGKFSVQAAGCGLCHIGALTSPPMPGKPATASEKNTVDCLVCHSAEYDWSKRATLVTDSTGTHWGQDHSIEAALSITKTPTNEACLRCHEHAYSEDYKRGTPYTPEHDVHAAAGLACVTCHTTDHHKIAKGMNESDMVANDLPDVDVSCSNCHGNSPHPGKEGATINAHTAKLACQTCHISQVSGIVYENWGKPVKDNINGQYSELSKFDNIPANPALYVPTDSIEKGSPSYIWNVPNSANQKNAQNWMAFATADIHSSGAKIFPVRGLTQVMLFDKNLKMWQFPGMSFLKENPQMKNFPLLLAPNREVYNKTGDIKKAVDAGMAPYKAMGFEWSGEWMPMEVPGTSYISVNHGVKKNGLSCNSCHTKDGVMDFAKLGYTDQQIAVLEQNK